MKFQKYKEQESIKYFHISVGNTTIGEFSIYFDEDEAEVSYLERLDIYSEYQNKGFGTDAIHQIIKEFGWCYAAPDNERCQKLLKRYFENIEDIEGYDDCGYADQGFGVYLLK